MARIEDAFAGPPSPNGPVTTAADFLNDLKEPDLPGHVPDGGVIRFADFLPDHHGGLIRQRKHTLSLAQLSAWTARRADVPHLANYFLIDGGPTRHGIECH